MFPKEGQKVSSHAKEFLERLKNLRDGMTNLDNDINKEFDKYSGDVRYFAEYQTGLQVNNLGIFFCLSCFYIFSLIFILCLLNQDEVKIISFIGAKAPHKVKLAAVASGH